MILDVAGLIPDLSLVEANNAKRTQTMQVSQSVGPKFCQDENGSVFRSIMLPLRP